MDANQINTFLSVAGGLVTALGGWEFVKYLLNRRSNSRIAEANAGIKEIEKEERELGVMQQLVESLRQRIEQQDEKIKELNERIDKIYGQLHQREAENNDLTRENNELRVALKEAEKHICWRPKDECFQRLIESDDCLYRKIIRGIKEKHPNAIVTEEDMKKPLMEKADEDNRVPEDADKG